MALLVGGVGIANVMVISVLERRAEIGVRRALGATRQHIRLQFLVESMLLAALGGTAGVAIGVVITKIYADRRDWTFTVPAVGLVGGIAASLCSAPSPASTPPCAPAGSHPPKPSAPSSPPHGLPGCARTARSMTPRVTRIRSIETVDSAGYTSSSTQTPLASQVAAESAAWSTAMYRGCFVVEVPSAPHHRSGIARRPAATRCRYVRVAVSSTASLCSAVMSRLPTHSAGCRLCSSRAPRCRERAVPERRGLAADVIEPALPTGGSLAPCGV